LDYDKAAVLLHELRHKGILTDPKQVAAQPPGAVEDVRLREIRRMLDKPGSIKEPPVYRHLNPPGSKEKFSTPLSMHELYNRFLDRRYGAGPYTPSSPYFDKILRDEWEPYAKDYERILKERDYGTPFAKGGLAHMLGEPTYAEGGRIGLFEGGGMTNEDLAAMEAHAATVENIVSPGGSQQDYEDRYNQMVQSHGGTPNRPPPTNQGGGDPITPKTQVDIGLVRGYFDNITKNRRRYLSILKKYQTDEFRKWQQFDPSLITEEEGAILKPYGTRIWEDMAKEDPTKFFEIWKGPQTGSPGVAPKVGRWNEHPTYQINRPRQYDWVAKGGRVGMGKGGLAYMLGE